MIKDMGVGFIIGKLIASLVELYPYLAPTIGDPSLYSELQAIFYDILLSSNIYHLVLGLIGGAIVVVWRSEGIFE